MLTPPFWKTDKAKWWRRRKEVLGEELWPWPKGLRHLPRAQLIGRNAIRTMAFNQLSWYEANSDARIWNQTCESIGGLRLYTLVDHSHYPYSTSGRDGRIWPCR